MNIPLKIYHHMPASVRGLAASLHGARLNWLRYGRDTPRLVKEARQREGWSNDQWSEWQKNALRELLKCAAVHVPHYRSYWGKSAGSEEVADIRNWPVLEKQTIREQPGRFISELPTRKKVYSTLTSGSTGTPTKVYWSAETARKWYALFEARWRNWYGITRFDRWAIIGGNQIVPPNTDKPPYWVYNRGMNQLYMSAYHLSAKSAISYVESLKKYQVRFVHTYTSGIYSLARFMDELGIAPPQLKVIVTNAEPLYAHQRELIRKVFNCPVRETYGMAEMVAGAGECEHGKMHLWPDAGFFEIDDGKGELKLSGTGQLIATGLVNLDMPLIRYRIGDSVTIPESGEKCDCGRTLPFLRSVEGRTDDLLITKDGREIGRLDPIFKTNYPIQEAQIVQKNLDLCVLKLVPSQGYASSVADEISKELKARMGGDIQVEVELLSTIPRGANGKFRAVVSEIT